MDKDFDVNFDEEFDESYSDDEEMRQQQIKAREWQKEMHRRRELEPPIDIRALSKYINENKIPFEERRGLWRKFIIKDQMTEEQARYIESEECKKEEAESWEEVLKVYKESKKEDNEG